MKLGLSAFMTVLALLVAPVANAADHDFAKWLVELRQEAKNVVFQIGFWMRRLVMRHQSSA
jgi:hypothetical protein